MTTLDNLKGKVTHVWDAFIEPHIQALETDINAGGQQRTNASRALYNAFYHAFNTPDDMPQNLQQTLSFDEINSILKGLASRQFSFLNTANRCVSIQDGIFRNVNSAQQANYPHVFESLSGEQLCACFYHFIFPALHPQRERVRLAINIPPGRIPDAVDHFLANSRNTDGDVVSFKVGAPGVYRKPDTALIYLLKPINQQQQTSFTALVQSATQWAGHDQQNTLRDWTHPLMEQLANGVATADDPPNHPAYAGLSFTALRAVITTIVISNLIRLGGGHAQVQGKTNGELAADAVAGQLENFGIDGTNPSLNAALPDDTTRQTIRDYALEIGAAVT